MSRRSWLVNAAIVLFLHGSFCLLHSRREQEEAEGLPRMTCDEFVRSGAKGKEFMTLTGARLCHAGDMS